MTEYKALKVNGKRIDEHRFIMEQHIGRKLKPDEIVHHKDGDKTNNDIGNLELMTTSEHSRMHTKGKPLSQKHKDSLSRSLKGRAGRSKLTDEQL